MQIITQNEIATLVTNGRISKILVDPSRGKEGSDERRITGLSLTTVLFPPGERSEEHAKASSYEIAYVVKGTMTLLSNGKLHTLQRGSVAIIAPGERHIHANEGSDVLMILIILTPPGPEQTFKKRTLLRDIPSDRDLL